MPKPSALLPHAPACERTALPKFELFAAGEKSFFARVSDSQITFESDSTGRATSLTLRKGGRDLPGPRLPGESRA